MCCSEPQSGAKLEGKCIQRLVNFPENLPLGHVQLYAAATAAAVGGAKHIWVARGKRPPHIPTAGLEFGSQVILGSKHPKGNMVPVMGQRPKALLWEGNVQFEPVPFHAAGICLSILIRYANRCKWI